MKYLGNYSHWEKLLESDWFESAYQGWLRELKIKLQAEALQTIHQIAREGSAQSLLASKYLASAEWEKPVRRAGAPSRQEMKGELARAVKQLTYEEDDAKRIGLSVVQGGK